MIPQAVPNRPHATVCMQQSRSGAATEHSDVDWCAPPQGVQERQLHYSIPGVSPGPRTLVLSFAGFAPLYEAILETLSASPVLVLQATSSGLVQRLLSVLQDGKPLGCCQIRQVYF